MLSQWQILIFVPKFSFLRCWETSIRFHSEFVFLFLWCLNFPFLSNMPHFFYKYANSICIHIYVYIPYISSLDLHEEERMKKSKLQEFLNQYLLSTCVVCLLPLFSQFLCPLSYNMLLHTEWHHRKHHTNMLFDWSLRVKGFLSEPEATAL